MSMKKWAGVAAAAVFTLALGACSGEGAGGDDATTPAGDDSATKVVGVAMPEQTLERWQADAAAVQDGLTEAGYEVELQFAGNDIPTQQEQIDQMITKGVDVLIVASIDGASLSTQLDAAASANIPVIAYDRLITGTENVDFYVTFDNFNVGVQQGTSLLQGLGILDDSGADTGEKGPFNIEIFAGSPDDNNATFFYNGAMSVVQPYIDNGTLVVKSGQTDFGQVATQGWDQARAQSRMDDLVTSSYQSDKVHGILASNDALGRGAITSLQSAGYTLDDIPVVTGQDAELASTKWINEGWQYSTIFKDTRKLAVQAVDSAKALLEGGQPEVNDTETYDNGVKVVPSFLLESDVVTSDNLTELLVDSGYYTQSEIDSGTSE
ncbi:multiple monosaccharide ABC transporter substrate-binding protein [Jonesia denitrificans]|uniref:Multiple sugar transport system (Multiple sugar-binding protein) n=1 Tax=Jonesia denitrificans (strain ATCC 14870 / DSM 20603 / BCRC 15368 / CIP 55.134 / JCM 11481 / NBRC 15587 / NCTC 10816 / Prevot 55134) TaxID=471856 RepID=C7R0A4_JONDD|nr:multiple monosaccharide ABC transporter substrate-binding protein [Jonesia denitrificans]ACV08163.1 multiple sugar transport system (multiple sugar- binding protein) [Jonesia denitrificans DSM 20603]ASE08161.1 sugar ABC transporter substrate-binding protein [Jonesia denitrificans]QXB42763.1 sugar-binding protein [Jonesia denitrificans]SQH20145.1 Multiple sugar-binding periplasmic protein sbpA precursor [Jonesia denitrificans]